MSVLAPSGVGLPAPDCLVTPQGASTPVPLSTLLPHTCVYLVLLPSVFGCEALLTLLANCTGELRLITADSSAALAAATLPAGLAIYTDPTLSFARLYGISCAPQGCHPALFRVEKGWLSQSYISDVVELSVWRALLAPHSA